MSGTSYPSVPSLVAVISPQFCTEYPVDLTIVRKTLSHGSFEVTDVNDNLMFKIKGKFFSLHDRHVLLDAAGNPIITFQQKLLSAHRRWVTFRGESTEPKDQLFSVKLSSLFQTCSWNPTPPRKLVTSKSKAAGLEAHVSSTLETPTTSLLKCTKTTVQRVFYWGKTCLG